MRDNIIIQEWAVFTSTIMEAFMKKYRQGGFEKEPVMTIGPQVR